jgi:hypothetical protein
MMTFDQDLIQWFMLLVIATSAILWSFKITRKQRNLEDEWQMFLKMRRELYERLADPSRVEEDLENSARRREMYDANRTTLPRENAGPPAVVYRPPLRGVKPGTWRPRNPGSPSKE